MRPHRWQPRRLPCPRDSPGKNTGVGCHFLLQCIKVKSESEVTQSCPTLRDPMYCSLPGSSVHGIFQARVLEWGAIAFSESMHKVHIIKLVCKTSKCSSDHQENAVCSHRLRSRWLPVVAFFTHWKSHQGVSDVESVLHGRVRKVVWLNAQEEEVISWVKSLHHAFPLLLSFS